MIKTGAFQQYPPGTQNVFVRGDENNPVIENGKDFSYPKGRRGRAVRNPKDFLEPGFPASALYFKKI
jgi:hypothetical protein